MRHLFLTLIGIAFILTGVATRFSWAVADNLEHTMSKRYAKQTFKDQRATVHDLINRTIGAYHDVNDFIIVITDSNGRYNLDNFVLEMVNDNKRLQITANNALSASWGFNYYLKYYCNSSINWSGKHINLRPDQPLPVVYGKVAITSNDFIRFYQNVCTYSYSYVWWDWARWEYEIDWMALNGINMVYAHDASEAIWQRVFTNMGLNQTEIDNFFTGPAYLAWFRMGNLKKFAGPLPQSWHNDQLNLQRRILQRYTELGIRYVLPAFAGFVPNEFMRLYPNSNFSIASEWIGFSCNYSCFLMIDPMDDLFKEIGENYIKELTNQFETNHLYSADIFNELTPKSENLTYLAEINSAVYQSMSNADPDAIWVMQSWLYNNPFWNASRVQASLSMIPKGSILILDLFAESWPHFSEYSSFYDHYFIWGMLHNYGGANGIFGPLNRINQGPDQARKFANSSMIGIGITMEGIEQNEFIYDFMLEKSWRHTLSDVELADWAFEFAVRRYTTAESESNQEESSALADLGEIWMKISRSLYNTGDFQNKQLFTKEPSFDLVPNNVTDLEEFFSAWNQIVYVAKFYNQSETFRYDLADISKEALRHIFSYKYRNFVKAWQTQDFYLLSLISSELIELLNDMEELLASDRHFLLGNWLNAAKLKATNYDERVLYEWNARMQITLWGTELVHDYACKAWSGLIKDYYIPRWKLFTELAVDSLINKQPFNQTIASNALLTQVELPFVTSRNPYPSKPTGDTVLIAQKLNEKYKSLFFYRSDSIAAIENRK